MGLSSRVSLAAVFLSLTQLPVVGDEFPSGRQRNQDIATGQLFIDSVHVASPYSISVSQDVVLINGHRLNASFSEDLFDWEPRERRDSPPDGAGTRRFGRMRLDGAETKRERWKPSSADVANLLAQTLRTDAIVVAFCGRDATVLSFNSSKATFCEALLSKGVSQDLERDFVQLCQDPDNAEQWASMFRSFEPSPELTQWMQRQVEAFDSVASANSRQIAAANRMQNASYPLTLVGMLLGVFAFGHTLKWSANSTSAADAVRFLEIGLILIIAMSALDLTWTILSSQAGHMREINPIAVNVIDSPIKLILFKIVATLGACGILYSLRSNPKVQSATWWMCLVCVLMTFRWVVFNSLMV